MAKLEVYVEVKNLWQARISKEQDTKRDLDRIKKRFTINNTKVLFGIKKCFFYTKQLTKIVKTLNKLSIENLLKNAREQNLKTRELAQLLE
jgi:hypothetical protein